MERFPSQPAIIAATYGNSTQDYERRAKLEAIYNSLRFSLSLMIATAGNKRVAFEPIMATINAAKIAAHRAVGA
jgi:hypothetical protein